MMIPSDLERISEILSRRFEIALKCSPGKDIDGNETIEIFPEDTHRNESFSVRLTLGWRSLKGELVPGPYASEIVKGMGASEEDRRGLFRAFVEKMIIDRADVQLQVNGLPIEVLDFPNWPESWQKVILTFEKCPLAINTETKQDTINQVIVWGGRFVGAVLSLVPLEEQELNDTEKLPEGALTKVKVNKYERSRLNRLACIEYHGAICKVCNFDFGRTYGELGEGYIHVHHIVPVSALGDSYLVDPVNDLVPLCPNCHSMIHRSDPPMSIDVLKELIASANLA